MKNQKFGQILFLAVAFAGIIGRSLYHNLRTLTGEEIVTTICALGKPIFLLWAFSITLGSRLAGIGAFVYGKPF